MKNFNLITAIATIALIISILTICILWYNAGNNERIIYSHRNEYHQIINYLFNKKIIEDQFAGDIIKDYPPTKISTHDNYLTLQYFNKNEELDDCCIYYSYYIHIIVRNNKLVKAFAVEGLFSEIDYVFFDVLSDSSEDEYWESRVKNAVTVSNF